MYSSISRSDSSSIFLRNNSSSLNSVRRWLYLFAPYGLYRDGACGRAASIADSARVRSFASLLK